MAFGSKDSILDPIKENIFEFFHEDFKLMMIYENAYIYERKGKTQTQCLKYIVLQ